MAHSHDRASESPALSSVVSPQPASPPGSSASDQTIAGPPARKDPLSEVLRTVKLTGALFFLVDATSPWGVEVPHAGVFGSVILPRAQHVVSYHIVLHGSGYASVPGLPPTRFAGARS